MRIIPCLTDEAVALSSFFKVGQPVCVGGVATAGTGGLSDAKARAACSDILTYTELGACHCAEKGFCQWTQKLPSHFCQGSSHASSKNSF